MDKRTNGQAKNVIKDLDEDVEEIEEDLDDKGSVQPYNDDFHEDDGYSSDGFHEDEEQEPYDPDFEDDVTANTDEYKIKMLLNAVNIYYNEIHPNVRDEGIKTLKNELENNIVNNKNIKKVFDIVDIFIVNLSTFNPAARNKMYCQYLILKDLYKDSFKDDIETIDKLIAEYIALPYKQFSYLDPKKCNNNTQTIPGGQNIKRKTHNKKTHNKKTHNKKTHNKRHTPKK